MTQDNFQTTVLQSLQKLESEVGGIKEKMGKLEEFVEDQRDFNARLWVVVENDIDERIAAHSDEMKSYTDQKIERHEKKFRHVAAV